MAGAIHQGADLTADVEVSCDVCIIGSGAGGAVLAAGLVERGLSVVMLEEGGHFTRDDFDGHEAHAFPMLYQDRGGRATADLAITILQGRSVGGGTTVNWTTCFRTPERILQHWQSAHGIEGWDAATLQPHFEAIEKRLHIAEWPESMANPNNKRLLEACRALGYEASPLRRNVNGCVSSGYCGMGCPVDAKQAMHVTYIPDAIAGGLQLYCDVRADRLVLDGNKVARVEASVLDRSNSRPTGRKVVVKPKVCVSSAGAINAPALMLRSGIDDNGRVGKRTFLHPVVAMPAIYRERIEPYFGAPQSIGSHQFFDRGADKVGWFLEVPPLQPMLTASGSTVFGDDIGELMANLPYVGAMLAIFVDGLVDGDEGGTVSLRDDGRIRVDYPFRPELLEAFREAHKVLARLSLAAGAVRCESSHMDRVVVTSEADIARFDSAPYGALEHSIFSAHQMGGCAMGPDPATSFVRPDLRHHRVENLYCVDGSVLPTSLGVNPSETIYGLAHRSRDVVAAAV